MYYPVISSLRTKFQPHLSTANMLGPAGPTLRAGARPVPPGRTGTGPGDRMPVYQPPLAASWAGAARGLPNAPNPPTVTAHMGDEVADTC